jgi:predicted enzyme related to lactoylglutathione lyase
MPAVSGLRTVIYKVSNIQEAKIWYSNALGISPYFDEPYYVGFNVGGFELGLDPDVSNVSIGNNSVAYWGVKNINDSLKQLLDAGAKINSDIQDVGSNILVASVKDPFGNILGLIENPHFKFEEN